VDQPTGREVVGAEGGAEDALAGKHVVSTKRMYVKSECLRDGCEEGALREIPTAMFNPQLHTVSAGGCLLLSTLGPTDSTPSYNKNTAIDFSLHSAITSQ
jgi:hypothetical protein